MLQKLNRSIANGLFYFTAFSAISFFLLILVAVVSRIWVPVLYAMEGSRILFIWSTFGAIALGYGKSEHIAFSLITDQFKPRARIIISILIQGLCLLFFLLIAVATIGIILDFFPIYLPVLGWSKGIFYWPIPFILFAICFMCTEQISDDLDQLRSLRST